MHCYIILRVGSKGDHLPVEDVADGDGYVELHCRQRGARVQHTGAEVAELPSLMVAQLL